MFLPDTDILLVGRIVIAYQFDARYARIGSVSTTRNQGILTNKQWWRNYL